MAEPTPDYKDFRELMNDLGAVVNSSGLGPVDICTALVVLACTIASAAGDQSVELPIDRINEEAKNVLQQIEEAFIA